MLRHDLLEKREPVHARHLDIERDHVRNLLADALGCNKRISGGGNHFDRRIGREHLAQRTANDCGIVYDQNANPRYAHGRRLSALVPFTY